MSPGEYEYRPHGLGLPPDFSCDGTSVSSPPFHQMPSYIDGLPRTHNDQRMLHSWAPLPSLNYDSDFTNAMPLVNSQIQAEWATAHASAIFDDQSTGEYYDYSANVAARKHDGALLRDHSTVIPRSSWSISYDETMLNDDVITFRPYDASTYTIEPIAEYSKGCGLLHGQQGNPRDLSRLSISPKSENDGFENKPLPWIRLSSSRVLSNESSDDSMPNSREMTAVEVENHGTDEPYARLIYRALMSVPRHAMVLQEIYQWFRENTSKGSSDTKGWMNSIRHNLSMNAAFKKTERKLSDDETKKSTEWVLEDFAIKDGVQSTTRYRKGTGSKKFARSENPAPTRQSSGRKGGICASKNKLQRQRFKNDRSDLRTTPRINTGVRSQFIHDGKPPHAMQRHVSPLTPTPESIPASSPYFMPKEEPDFEDMCGLPEGIRGFEDVEGVFLDNTPIFSDGSNYHPTYHTSRSFLSRY